MSPRLYWGTAALAAAGLCLLALSTGVWVIRQNEQGVVLRFGRVTGKVPPGMHWTLPWPFETVRRVATTEVRTMPIGFKLVDQVRSVAPSEDEVQWVTGDTNIIEIQTTVQYRVAEPADYLFRVADLEGGQLRDFALRPLAESALTPMLARRAVDDLLSGGKGELQEEARHRIQELCDAMHLGLGIVSVSIVKVSPPAAVISSFNDVSSARADRERKITEADGYAKDLLPKARAQADGILQQAEIYRSGVVNAAQGGAQAFLHLEAEVRLAPAVSLKRLWFESVERALAGVRLVVYPRQPGRTFHLVQRD